MDLLAYWRYDNYLRDLDNCALATPKKSFLYSISCSAAIRVVAKFIPIKFNLLQKNERNYRDKGAGFHFNSNQSRLHTAIDIGKRLWLFTRVVNAGRSEYRLLARLNVVAKTINAPDYQYGPYRVWGDTASSRYFKVMQDSNLTFAYFL